MLFRSVTLNKNALSLEADKSETLTATVAPANASNKAVTWKSSKPEIASIDANGKVTAKKAGTTDITVTTVDGNKTAVCKLTVTAKKIAKPKKVTNVKAKAAKKKATISWKKASKATGYQVIYSTDKKFKKGKATKTVTIKKVASKSVIKKLKSNKTYYFKVRAFNKNAAGKTQYGSWSKVVKKKIK